MTATAPTEAISVHPVRRCTSPVCDWQDRPHTWTLTLNGFRLRCDSCGTLKGADQ